MEVYIRSIANVSPQKTFNHSLFLNEISEYNDNRLTCIEPDYNALIDLKLRRRMSRVIKMSVASAFACLKEAGITDPDAIVTATAYGCLEDTVIFLTNMVEHNEEPLAPTAFVQATHNTIGAQIALLLKCKGYNNTFVSGGASFENALLDAMMLLTEKENAKVLVGGMDEITDFSHTVLSRLGLYKRKPLSNLDLFKFNTKGTIGGEGAAFFLLTGVPSENNFAAIDAVATFYKPENILETAQHIGSFLKAQSIVPDDVDLLITGNNGDPRNDEIYLELQKTVLKGVPFVNYKNLCGEYPTSTAFALWMGANIVKTNGIPATLNHNRTSKNKINKVLIYNHYQNVYHSLILISSC
jgi:3-oxoacyl-[acyl-carrier-protein] synthase II